MQNHTLPHGNLLLRIETPIGNVVQLKHLIHPTEEHKFQQPDKSKEEVLQGSISATTSMMNLRRCLGRNMMIFLNGVSTRRMAVKSRKNTKENKKLRPQQTIKQKRK